MGGGENGGRREWGAARGGVAQRDAARRGAARRDAARRGVATPRGLPKLDNVERLVLVLVEAVEHEIDVMCRVILTRTVLGMGVGE